MHFPIIESLVIFRHLNICVTSHDYSHGGNTGKIYLGFIIVSYPINLHIAIFYWYGFSFVRSSGLFSRYDSFVRYFIVSLDVFDPNNVSYQHGAGLFEKVHTFESNVLLCRNI